MCRTPTLSVFLLHLLRYAYLSPPIMSLNLNLFTTISLSIYITIHVTPVPPIPQIRDCLHTLLNQHRNSHLFPPSVACPYQAGGLLQYLLSLDMSDEEIVDHLYALLSASIQTTTFFMSFLVLLLAENPQAQENLRHEIFMHAGGLTGGYME